MLMSVCREDVSLYFLTFSTLLAWVACRVTRSACVGLAGELKTLLDRQKSIVRVRRVVRGRSLEGRVHRQTWVGGG